MHTKYCLRLLAPTLLLTAVPASSPSPQELETVPLKGRDGTTLEAEYGSLAVPENRADPQSREIELAFVRVASPLENPGPPVFFLAGGPGGPSIEAVENFVRGGGAAFFELVGGDIVGVDQRGVGRSRPNLTSDTLYELPIDVPGDPRQHAEIMARVSREEAARWRAAGVDLAGYTTVESADDIDAVRRALGYDTISLWGGSYGSHLAMAVLRRHGEHVARALLTAPEGPDHTVKLPSYAQEGLERIAELAAADPALVERVPDLLKLIEDVLQRLEESPVTVDVEGTAVGISAFDLKQWIVGSIGYDPRAIAELPAALVAMQDGDYGAIARSVLEDRRTAGVFTAMAMVMDAASGMSAAREARIAREAPTTLLGDVGTYAFRAIAEAWDAPDLGDAFRGPLESDVPCLFIAGDLDSRTPVSNALDLMEHLPNAQLIVVENAAHNLPMGLPPLRQAWSDFLRGRPVELERVDAGPIRFVPLPGVVRQPPPGAVAVPVEALEACAGRYEFPNGMVFVIRPEAGFLNATIPGKGDFELWPTSDRSFFSQDPNIPPLTFEFDDAGRAVAVAGGGIRGERKD